jgi:hypothetical protein
VKVTMLVAKQTRDAARIDRAAAQDPIGIDQHRVRQLADLIRETERGRQEVRMLRQPVVAYE